MGALCVHVDAQPCASNPERKGGKLRDKVQHNEPSLRAQYKPPRVSTVRVRDATGGGGVRGVLEGSRLSEGQELSASDITWRAATERAAAQANISDAV